MEREVAERFERIEANLSIVAQSQVRTEEIIGTLAQSVTTYVDASDARMKRVKRTSTP